MSNGAAMDYRFGRKNNWRRTVWNELIRRVINPDGIVLYLGGRENYDRELLLSKGIKDWNIVNIDRNIETVELVRKRRELCIHGDIFEVLSHFPKTPWVSCVSFDLCGPIGNKLITTLRGYFDFSWFPWAINIMRGRESCPTAREMLKYHRGLESHYYGLGDKGNIGASKYFTHENKNIHRGIILYSALLRQFFEMDEPLLQKTADGKGVSLKEIKLETLDLILKNTAPSFFTYKSDSGQIFDSFVMSPRYPGYLDVINGVRFPECNNKLITRKISAILAHRTRRQNEKHKSR